MNSDAWKKGIKEWGLGKPPEEWTPKGMCPRRLGGCFTVVRTSHPPIDRKKRGGQSQDHSWGQRGEKKAAREGKRETL